MERKIQKLDEKVVNRIAAGEVIQRPANAIKEMIENSLDAKATLIQVTVKSGGLKLIQIQDNGHGIKKEDLDIVCERFTTSKLSRFEDLSSMVTYGFRGEALASISHVAHVAIVTRTEDSKCAYRATYADGKMVPGQPNASADPKPCAGNVGTQINVEDLFFNTPLRLKALKNPNEEFNKITEVISRYAVHQEGVGFILKKYGDSNATVRTSGSSRLDNIRTIYGASTARELLEVSLENKKLGIGMNGLISNANYSAKKCIFLLFINHRLVECSNLRKAIENVYAAYLPKHTHPFLYLSLQISPRNVDVNMHPTKHEVQFLHEDKIIDAIQNVIENKLLGANSSRTFLAQTFLPTTSGPTTKTKVIQDNAEVPISSGSISQKKAYAHQLVRTDHLSQKLEIFLEPKNPTSNTSHSSSCSHELEKERPAIKEKLTESEVTNAPEEILQFILNRERRVHYTCLKSLHLMTFIHYRKLTKQRELKLTSVQNLRNAVEENVAEELQAMVRGMQFVGCVTESHAAFQFETGLYLGNTTNLSKELFYQSIIFNFGNFEKFRLSSPASLYDLAMLALDSEDSGWTEEDGSKEDLAQHVSEFLQMKGEMMTDYFSLEIDKGCIKTLPMLLDGYEPDLLGLPMFALRLATEVNWDHEESCFKTFAIECSRFYAMRKGHDLLLQCSEKNQVFQVDKRKMWKWKVEHLLYPAFKSSLFLPKRFQDDGTILKIADLKELYKVFERC
ncbi:uncharacterized protein TRIADDRAFT_50100 [Trichoplax adhaerens]|uniref:DNA mismatch repair protein MLH1 n=1 Tax=Trichoplax adhaerens TaxID=10228 RepID=B3RQF3_TRIAD|nr:hypothetical protein TRIADDRAFT_50100 [Trichoplax adhaerens]EDV27230.1 hypothetical protein TRIADDRAFT_50100 [Trichoplax adhaerens]|eukprot:XP_002111226.1 hypothetical protein TRIADDRAFT_50100 [Trichoplax adhaerens]